MWTALILAMQFYLAVITQIVVTPTSVTIGLNSFLSFLLQISLVMILVISGIAGAYLGYHYHDSKYKSLYLKP